MMEWIEKTVEVFPQQPVKLRLAKVTVYRCHDMKDDESKIFALVEKQARR